MSNAPKPGAIPPTDAGRAEMRDAFLRNIPLFGPVFFFSLFVNALMLVGPIYMLQVYDRVLGSQSQETLLALSILVAFLYLMMGLLDYARGRVLARAGARVQDLLDGRVYDALMRKAAVQGGLQGATGLRDLESIQRLMSSPALLAVFDIPWTPLFIMGIFIFHPWLGYLALAGGSILIVITVLNQWLTRRPGQESQRAATIAEVLSNQTLTEAETIRALGMTKSAFARWQAARGNALSTALSASDRGGAFTATTKTFRLFLQSAMLGLGALLVLKGELTAGAMIAGSILMGRALAPIEQAIGQWPLVQRAMKGRQDLMTLLSEVPPEKQRTVLPRPEARLKVDKLTVIPPHNANPALRMVSFDLPPGTALGVIGPSGAGKSSLARALTGVWPAAGGTVRLGGATLDQYDPDVLGSLIGYLPQKVTLFDGTIAENIARLAPEPDPQKVVEAAQKADAHAMILDLPKGYDTPVSVAGGRLSGGQIQRVGLARALYGDPVVLVLDEPNSNLDNSGSEALNAAIRQMKAEGKSVLIMAHRPAAIQHCELLLVLDGGVRRAFGPRDEVLQATVSNAQDIRQTRSAGGIS